MSHSLRFFARAAVMLLLSALMVAQAGAALPANAVAQWKAENNANDSVGSNNGTLQGSATYGTGYSGQAFSFANVGDYVLVPDAASLSFASSFTIEGWVNMVDRNFFYMVITKNPSVGGSNYPGNYELRITPSNGYLEFGMEHASGGGLTFWTSTTAVPLNQWVHVAMVFTSASSVKFYINGVLSDTFSTGVTPLVNNNPLRIAARADGYSLNGRVDELTLYSRALSGSEISARAGATPEINVTGNSVSIASGDVSPSTGDFTDFGTAAVSGGTVVRAFVIQNTGTSTLNISSITSNNGQFVVSGAPSTVAASGSATFYVTFDPSGTGAQSATITINNDDADEGTYTFSVAGTGAATAAQAYDANSGGGNGTGNGTADTLRVRLNGSNIEFSANNFSTISSIPASSVTSLTLTGSDDDDTFVIDFSGGNPIPSGGITVNGGNQVTGDKLRVTGGIFGTVLHSLSNAHDGFVSITGFGTINYTGLEPVDMTGSTVTDLIFNMPGTGSNAILEDDGTPANTFSTFREAASGFELTTFQNPSGSLTINRGNAGDTVTINATPDFTATLTVGAAAFPVSSVTVAGGLTLAANKNFTVYAANTVNFSTGASDVALSGTGAVSITTTRDIALASGASLTTVNGNLTLSANAAGTGTGNFAGINNSGLIQASGTGVVSLTGQGGDTGTDQNGIYVHGGGSVIGGTAGTMTLTGTGGSSTGNDCYGIRTDGNGTTVTSGGANVTLIGNGTAAAGGNGAFGVGVRNGSIVSAGGSGAVSVTGTGGARAGGTNVGVSVQDFSTINPKITSSGGNVTVTGTGGGSGASNLAIGVGLYDGGIITAGGSGAVSIVGIGGPGTGGLNDGVRFSNGGANLSSVTSSGGNVSVIGKAGAVSTSIGIRMVVAGDTITTATSGGNVALISDTMAISGLVSANNASSVTLRQANSADVAGEDDGDAINLGSAIDTTANTLELSDAELDRVTAGTVLVGNGTSGAITVSAGITHPNNLTLTSGGAVAVNSTLTLAATKNLSVSAAGAITQSGVITVPGTASFTTGGFAITLTQNNDFTGAVSLTNTGANNVQVTDANAIDLGTVSVGQNLTVTASGAITDSGTLTVAGSATFAAGSGNNITLNSAGNNYGSIGITTGNNVTLVENSATALNASTISGTLDLTSNGAVTDNGNISVTGTATIAAGSGNNITLDNTDNFSTVVITSGNNVTLVDSGAIDLGASTVSGTLSVTASGAITDSGNLSVTSSATFAAGAANNITLNSAGNNFGSIGITTGNNVTIVENSATALNASTISGTLDLTSNGAVTDNGIVSVTGTATIAAGSGNNITLDNSDNFSTVVITSGNNVTLVDSGTIDLGASTVSGTLNVTASGAITDSGNVSVAGTMTLAAGAANSITLDSAGNNFSTVAITTGLNVTLVDGTGGMTLNASTISGTLSASVTAAGQTLTVGGALAVTGATTFIADDMAINANVTGTTSVTLRQSNATRPIDLGTDTAGTLGLTDTELDRFTAATTLNIGNTSSGAVAVSAGITRAVNTALSVTTAANNAIAFSGAGNLNAGATGSVTLTTSGTGAITSGTSTPDITARSITLAAGSGGVGASGNPIAINGDTTIATGVSASTTGNADIYLAEADSVNLEVLNAGTGTIHLVSGTFQLDSGSITTITGSLDIASTLDQIAPGRSISGGSASDTVTLTATGVLNIYGFGTTPYGTMFNAAVATGRKPPTLNSGSTVNWLGTTPQTVDVTSFGNVNFNGATTFTLSANTSVASGNTMTVNSGSQLNTSTFIVNGAGNFTLASGGALGIGSTAGITSSGATGSIQVSGARSFNTGSTYVYNGSSGAQVTGNGLPATVAGLTINNASGVTAQADETISSLVLTSGILDARANSKVLTVVANSGASSASYVLGDVRHVFAVASGQSFTYPVGETGYSPVTLTDVNGSTGGGITVTAHGIIHPNIVVGGTEIAGLNDTKTLKRYWTFSKDTFVGTFDPQLNYVDPTDLPAGENEGILVMRRYSDDGLGTQWYDVGAATLTRNTVANTVKAGTSNGVGEFSGMGDYTLGEQAIGYYDIAISGGGIGILQNTAANLIVSPKDYVGINVLAPHESVDLTFYASPALTFQFDGNGNSTFAEVGDNIKLAQTGGSFFMSVKDATAETVDVYVQDQLGRFGYKSVLVGHTPTASNSGGAVKFDGSGRYGYTPNLKSQWPAAGVTGHENITVELWFNSDATGGVLFDERGTGDTRDWFDSWIELVPVAGQLEVRIRVWNVAPEPTTGVLLGTVAAGSWHHVVLRYDETGTGLLDGFLDGVKASASQVGDRITPQEGEMPGLYFGLGLADKTNLGSGAAFSGKMDEVRIWNVARSDYQITNNWNKPVDASSANLVAYYQFEEGIGSTSVDSGVNDYQVTYQWALNGSQGATNGNATSWVASGAMTNAADYVYQVQVGSTVVIPLNGYDPDHTGVLTASKTGAVTGSGGTLTQYDGTAIGAGTVLVTNPDRLVKVTGTGTGTITFNYLVNNGIADSASITVTVNIVAANGAPVIGTAAPTLSGTEDVVVNMTYASLVTAFAATDGGSFDFRITAPPNGSLRKNGTMVVDYPLTVASGDTLDWIPPINTNGVVVAFSARANDGVQYSATTGTLSVNLTPVNDVPVATIPHNALQLNGTNYLFTPDLRTKFTDETVTLELWFKPTTNGVGGFMPGVLVSERGQNSLPDWRDSQFELMTTGEVKARMWTLSPISLGTVNAGEWNHVVVRYSKANLKCEGFLNGVKAAGFTTGDRLAPWEGGCAGIYYDVGAYDNSPSNLGTTSYFKGYVCEFRVWSVARSDFHIVTTYPGQDISTEPGLVAWYKLASTANDFSTNALNGRLLAGAGGTVPTFVPVPVVVRPDTDGDQVPVNPQDVVIKLPGYDVEKAAMSWNITQVPTNGVGTVVGRLFNNFGGARGPEITAASPLNPLSAGKVLYAPPVGAPETVSFVYSVSAGGQTSPQESVTVLISATAALSSTTFAVFDEAFHARFKAELSAFTPVSETGGDAGASRFSLASTSGGGNGGLLTQAVQLVAPAPLTQVTEGEVLTVQVQAAGGDVLTTVTVYIDGLAVGVASLTENGTYDLPVAGLPAGSYVITAIATNPDGTSGLAAPVVFGVSPARPNQ